MMFNGGTISWGCRKQTSVSLEKLIRLKRLQRFQRVSNLIIFEDNQSARKMLESENFSNRIKHIVTRFQFARHVKEEGEVQFVYWSTEEMADDLLAKPRP